MGDVTVSEHAHYLVEADISYQFADGRPPTVEDGMAVQDLLNAAIDTLYKSEGLSDVGVVLDKGSRALLISILVTADDAEKLPEEAMVYAVTELRTALNAAQISTPGWPTRSMDGLSVRVRSAKVTEEPKVEAYA